MQDIIYFYIFGFWDLAGIILVEVVYSSFVGLLTIVEGPSQPGTASQATLNVTILSFGKTKHIYIFTVRVKMT